MFKRIDHVALHVSDLGRSVKFYEQHFGFKHYFQHAAGGGLQIAYLKLGDTAPDFALRDTAGKEVKLSDFRGKKNVILAFYVFAFTGG